MLKIDLIGRDIIDMYDDLDWNMAESVEEIRKLAAALAEQAVEEDRQTVLLAWQVIYMMERTADQEGLLALGEKLETYPKRKVPFRDFLKPAVHMLVEGVDISLILEVMTNDFYTRKQEAVNVLILYFYVSCIRDIAENFRTVLTEGDEEEETGKDIAALPIETPFLNLMGNYLELIPEKYRGAFIEVWE